LLLVIYIFKIFPNAIRYFPIEKKKEINNISIFTFKHVKIRST
jgi:hypothetical protein